MVVGKIDLLSWAEERVVEGWESRENRKRRRNKRRA